MLATYATSQIYLQYLDETLEHKSKITETLEIQRR
jgi:hypothetical protein